MLTLDFECTQVRYANICSLEKTNMLFHQLFTFYTNVFFFWECFFLSFFFFKKQLFSSIPIILNTSKLNMAEDTRRNEERKDL